MNIIIFGPPGSGKGTQSKKLAEKYKLTHISTGDLLREEKEKGTELGKKLDLGSGKLVDDETVLQLIENKIKEIYATQLSHEIGFVFDGFPRTIEQAIALNQMIDIDKVVLLIVKDEEVTRRILIRGEKSGRLDDNKESIIKRLKEYTEKTYPMKQMYSLEGKLSVVNGALSVEEVFDAICKIVEA